MVSFSAGLAYDCTHVKMADAFSDELFEVFEEKSTPLPVARPSETVDVEVKPSRSDAER